MLAHDQAYGVLVVQSYDPTVVYTKSELDLLAFIASHVAVALARRPVYIEASRPARLTGAALLPRVRRS